jgi:hypothetical protein
MFYCAKYSGENSSLQFTKQEELIYKKKLKQKHDPL